MSEITGNISLKTKTNVNIYNEIGGNIIGKVYLPNGKELEIFDPATISVYNCNGILILEITHLWHYGGPPEMRERMIGNFVLLTWKDVKIEDCEKSDKNDK